MPTLTFSIAALRAANACDLDERVAELRAIRPDVSEYEPVPLTVWWSLPSTSIPDRWWSLRVAAPLDTARQVSVRAAAMAARRVLHLTRAADRQVCERAVLAAEAWADQPAAAAYADRAARAADAARAAAYAPRVAAYAAAYAAFAAAADAADAAAYAAACADRAATCAAAAADADADDADAYAAAAAAEREAQRADLDRLIMETDR